jgi:DNA primase catalytic core
VKVDNYEDVIEQLRPYLQQYLQRQGIDTDKHFKCINPAHHDHDPSCHIFGDQKDRFFCHGCNCGGSILDAAHYLEGKPLSGPEFVQDNLMYLAGLFGIEVQVQPPTEEELYRIQTFRAYADAARVIGSFGSVPKIEAELARRGWSMEFLREHQVGWVPSFKDYRDRLLECGYDPNFLDDIDLGFRGGDGQRKSRPNPIFNKDQLIFTIKDEHGRPCGFASRNLNYSGQGDKKYCNSATLPKCDIYRKSERLYGFHLTRKLSGPLYIVEGYADKLSLHQAGIHKSVAIGGTAFTDKHLDTLKKYNCRDLVVALDGDESGQRATAELVQGVLAGQKDLQVRVITLPDNQDPDDFIRAQGAQAWIDLPHQTAFEWQLSRFDPRTDGETVCQAMIPMIVNEASMIKRETMCRQLSSETGYSVKAIAAELDRLTNVKEALRINAKEEVIEKAYRSAKRNPDEAEVIMHQAIDTLQELNQVHNRDQFSQDECLSALNHQVDHELTKSAEAESYRLGPYLEPLEECFEGGDLKTAFIGIGGSPNVGKSNLMTALAVNIAQYNQDVLVIYHSIDDTRESTITRMAMQVLGSEAGDIKLNWLKNPKYYFQKDPQLLEKHQLAYDRLRNLISSGRLVVKDMGIGNTLGAVSSLLSYYRHRYPERDIVFFLDNFHKLKEEGDKDDYKAETADLFKDTLKRHRVTGFCTMEYHKLHPAQRPADNNIHGAAKIIYDADIVIHLYNELHGLKQDAKLFHLSPAGEHWPTLELNFSKNKVNDYKGMKYLDMVPERASFSYVPPELLQERLKDENRPGGTAPSGYYTVNGRKVLVGSDEEVALQ